MPDTRFRTGDGGVQPGGDIGVEASVDQSVDADASVDARTDAPDASLPTDIGVRDAILDADVTDAMADVMTDADAMGGGNGLDPRLFVPPENAPMCTLPGLRGECGSGLCRFYSADESRCESCDVDANCKGVGRFCEASNECDILFTCYANVCTLICELGTSYCGRTDACLEIGHPTHGVCDPSLL